MIAAVPLHAVEFVRNRQRRKHRDFLRVYRLRHIGDGVHFFVHVLRELLHVLPIQFSLDGVRLPEDLHFHRPAHGVSARPYRHNITSAPRMGRPMATNPRRKKSPAALQHPIRVVPLHRPEAERIAPAVAPHLTYRGGPLLTAVEVFTIFWGAEWNQSPQSVIMKNINLFFDYILTSALMDQLGEYSVPGKNIGHGTRAGTTILASPAPSTSVQDSEIQQLLQQEIASKNLPAPNPNSLYFVFLPPGAQVVQGGSASCQDFCGYHDSTSGNIFYAVMPYPGCSGCAGGLTVADAFTSTSSHELCEAITDPVPL